MEGDPKVIISRLRKELDERNSEVRKAATVGNDLLKQKMILSEKLEHLYSENENLKQEKYSLQLDLDTQHQTVSTQAAEIESQRDQCDRLTRKVYLLKKELLAHKEQITSFEREKCDMEKNKEELQHENQVLKTKLDSLKNQMQELELKASEYLDVVDTKSVAENSVEYYKCINKQLNEAISDLKQELESVKSSEQVEKKKVEELQEVLREKSKDLAAYSVEIQEAKELFAEMQVEAEKLKLEQTDQNRRGNSVFGEIDDRRKIIEREYKVLAKRYEDLGHRYRAIKKELVLCKDQMASMTSRKYHERHIQILQSQLYKAKDDLEHLNTKVSTLTRDKGTDEAVTSSNEYGYLVAMHNEDKKEIKQLEKDLLRLGRQKVADDATISQLSQELYQVQMELDDVNQKNFKLQLEVKEHSLFKDPEESTNQGAEVSVREFDPNEINGSSNLRKSTKDGLNPTTKVEVMKHADCNKSRVEDTSKPAMNRGLGSQDKFDPKQYIQSAEYKALKTRFANQDQRKQQKDVQCAQQ